LAALMRLTLMLMNREDAEKRKPGARPGFLE
jgi:hypothetical protein